MTGVSAAAAWTPSALEAAPRQSACAAWRPPSAAPSVRRGDDVHRIPGLDPIKELAQTGWASAKLTAVMSCS